MTAIINNNLLYLRKFSESDIPMWASWFNNPEITHFMNKGETETTVEMQRKHMEAMEASENDVQLAVVEKQSDMLVGSVGLHKISQRHQTADLSILIGEPQAWGKGYGTAAIALMVTYGFLELGLHKITGGMWSGNAASEKCFINNGFKHEGTKRQQFFCEGEYLDELCYGLLRSEWSGQNN